MNKKDKQLFRREAAATQRLHGPERDVMKVIDHRSGHEAMTALNKHLPKIKKKWPGRVHVITCDDSVHATSNLVVITHEDPRLKGGAGWFGVTLLFLPQLGGFGGTKPVSLFLYDWSRLGLDKVLAKISKRRARYGKEIG